MQGRRRVHSVVTGEWRHPRRHRGRRRTLARSMPSKIRRQIAPSHLDSSRRRRTILLHNHRWFRHLERSTISSRLYHVTRPSPANHSTFTRSPRRLKRGNRWPGFHLLAQFSFHHSDQALERLSHIGRAGLGKDPKGRRQGQHARALRVAGAAAGAATTAPISIWASQTWTRSTTPPGH